MVSRKYLKDYVLQDRMDERGRMSTVAEYIGPQFRFVREGESLARAKRITMICAAAAFVCGLLPLCVTGKIVGCWYVMLPAVFSMFPSGMLLLRAVRLLRAAPRLRREERDRMDTAPPALATAILGGATLAGEFAFCAAHGFAPVAAALIPAAALQLLTGLFAWRQRGVLETEEV